ncbi:unnamed protein product [marine sediment metagenome]|uniref:Uncharacterized protein n=1 Tax=marine sediment metagenome TaxID=412755 RepID=X1LWP3_9ZZZZ
MDFMGRGARIKYKELLSWGWSISLRHRFQHSTILINPWDLFPIGINHGTGKPIIDRKQVEEEKTRVYAPVKRKGDMGWKELHAGICRIMQDYCGEYKSEQILKMGLWWLNSIRESEAQRTYARNPHELWRTLECLSRLTVGEMIMHASLARKANQVS